MNRMQNTAEKVFTPEFLMFLDTIPKKFVKKKKLDILVQMLDKQLDNKRVVDCLLALSFYLTSLVSEHGEDLDITIDMMKDFDDELKTENYIG